MPNRRDRRKPDSNLGWSFRSYHPMEISCECCLRTAPLIFNIGVATLASGAAQPLPGGRVSPITVIGIIFFIFSMIIILASPYLLLISYRGKFWGTQAWFFGIEGYVPVETIEEILFGINQGRLKWSSNGSMLSQHRVAENPGALKEECE